MRRLSWERDFEAVTGERIKSRDAVSGGDIASSYRVDLASGARCFLKHYAEAPAGQTEAEAKGLRWLGEPGVISVAQVMAVGDSWLALEWIDPGRRRPDSAALLGRQLAELHHVGAGCFGLEYDNWIGRVHQRNPSTQDWPTFYAERRLRPLIEQASDTGGLEAADLSDFETLFARLPEIVGPSEPPARLHGDLWNGNVLFDLNGRPWLIDPAVYGGHREVDLAMMALFGGFEAEVFAAYEREAPLSTGAHTRVELYQLYPLLVHLLLFGRGYRSSVMTALRGALR